MLSLIKHLLAVIAFTALISRAQAFVPSRFGVIGTSSQNDPVGSQTLANAASAGMAPPMSPTMYSSIGSDEIIQSESNHVLRHEQERQDWIDRSVTYYSKVMREERRRNMGQVKDFDTPEYQEDFVLLAKKHYFAIRKVKDGKLHQAELIYRRIIDELMADEDQCDHAKLAVTTLLLALLTKRMGDPKKTRSVFLHFFKLAVLEREEGTECACSAKVLQAYALFEMQQGNALKSLEIVKKALQFDRTLAPVLQWKQFREALYRAAQNGRDDMVSI